jgi:hypothetical protein
LQNYGVGVHLAELLCRHCNSDPIAPLASTAILG